MGFVNDRHCTSDFMKEVIAADLFAKVSVCVLVDRVWGAKQGHTKAIIVYTAAQDILLPRRSERDCRVECIHTTLSRTVHGRLTWKGTTAISRSRAVGQIGREKRRNNYDKNKMIGYSASTEIRE